MESMSSSVTSLIQTLAQLDPSRLDSEDDRAKLKEALYAAFTRFETPYEAAMRITATEPALCATLKVCYDIGLFSKWRLWELNDDVPDSRTPPSSPSSVPVGAMTVSTLAAILKVDTVLLERLLRHLVATNVLQSVSDHSSTSQPSPTYYYQTALSRALGEAPLSSTIPFIYDTTLPGFANLPRFLESIKYSNPSNVTATNWHHFRGASRFDDLKRQGDAQAFVHFQNIMRANAENNPAWTSIVDSDELYQRIEADGNSPAVVVDVGGGGGADIERMRKFFDAAEGWQKKPTLILEDLAPQLENSIGVHKSVLKVAHDFFAEEQPVKGASVYLLHKVLHDWPNDKAVSILKGLARAARPDYSRILIHEIVVTEQPLPGALVTTFDLQMMMVHSAAERSEAEWRALIQAAGLDVCKIWHRQGCVESVIEVVKRG